MDNNFQQQRAAHLVSMFEDEGTLFLKSEENKELLKGRKADPLGMKKQWGGKDYIKTATGWKPVGKQSGAAKAAHDYVHGEKKSAVDGIINLKIDGVKKVNDNTIHVNIDVSEKNLNIIHDYMNTNKIESEIDTRSDGYTIKIEDKVPDGFEAAKSNSTRTDGKKFYTKESDGVKHEIVVKKNGSAYVTSIDKNSKSGVDEHSQSYDSDIQDFESLDDAVKHVDEYKKKEDKHHTVSEHTAPYQGNKDAKWVKVTHSSGASAGASIDKFGSKEAAITAAKANIKSNLEKESKVEKAFDPSDIRKAQAARLLSIYGGVDDIEKAGEGSRGGKVIGHTKSGKAIYQDHNHSSHKKFTSADHMDASDTHMSSDKSSLDNNHKDEASAHHYRQTDEYKAELAERKKKAAK